jgi:(p)ppGpp synthase/HD superfamily hydrolase
MHAQAERGLAAHWAYKEGKPSADLHVPWIDDLVEILDHAESPEELLEHTRMAMYQDRIFAFTPKGELIQLPKGATPVDFAYAVHTDLGDRPSAPRSTAGCAAAHPLENGDQVEILASEAQHPQPSGCASSPPARRAPASAASSATRSARRRSSSAARSTTRSSPGCRRRARQGCAQARAQEAQDRE